MIKLEPRVERSNTWSYLSPVLAILLTLITGYVVFALLGHDPLNALYTLLIAPISDWYGVTELLVMTIPILLCAYGLALCYRASVWNIGAEGQLLIGGVCASAVAVNFVDSTSSFALGLTLLAGIAGGMMWAGLAAFMKLRLNTNEILVTIMLNYIAVNVLLWSVHGPLKDPYGYNFPESALFGDSTLLPVLFEGTRLHLGLAFALLALCATWVFISKTFVGFQIQVLGLDASAAKMAGYKRALLIAGVLVISGGLAGLAGAGEVAGPIGQLVPQISPGYGYAAIIVAFLGRLHPLGITLAGLLMGLIYMGGEMAQIEIGLPNAITGIFQGLMLFYLLSCDVLIGYRIKLLLPFKQQKTQLTPIALES
ncbi:MULTISPECIES: ABC transporter permease [Pseudoalteromonas]|jgi:simple sugar transport system permease protein|uniref:ABC transporter permease n=1 Tax=Pseudoalteromonas TaxID=53246 RepID=UPI0002C9B9F5|nr:MULTISPECIES: ABC transporter permease [Pseudoalteromonas]ENN99565.1 ABC transporter permease [Pseudoalteromonas agarivorans S816]MDI3245805.1 ABC transporter permease [Pseudoalteromonas agarivorans]TMS68868.1 ABC transporter permease [Pseudoalteromonas sp. S1691]TMS69188.1 ABC transporter permease [Pseudoalteromonas sp. S1731]TMS73809.1 ABC transporter permease [Pseudoalteromonas sp. S1941]